MLRVMRRVDTSISEPWRMYHHGCTSCKFEIGVFAPLSMLSKLPAMITPESDESIVSLTNFVQGSEHLADHSISLCHRSVVCTAKRKNIIFWQDCAWMSSGIQDALVL